MITGVAGLDCGTTYMKAVWRGVGSTQCFLSSRNNDQLLIWATLKAGGVEHIRTVGIGNSDVPTTGGFEFLLPECTNLVEDEFCLQVRGARMLAQVERIELGGFYLVSLGTGVSFTVCRSDGTYMKAPLGHAFGGGFLDGMARLLDIPPNELFSSLPFTGCPPNVLVKDVLPQTCGFWAGDLVQSHFGMAQKGMPKADVIAGLFEVIAVETASHVFQIGLQAAPDCRFRDIVFVGTLARNPYLRERLNFWMDKLELTPHFLKLGDFAAAMGAYLELAAPGEEP